MARDQHSPPNFALHVWRWQADGAAGVTLRPVIALVFYHGVRRWTIPTQFLERFEQLDPIFHAYVPNFRYILFDTNSHDDAELRSLFSSHPLQASLLLLKYIYDDALADRLPDVLDPLRQLPEDEVLDKVWAIVRYITSAAEQVNEEQLYSSLEEVFDDKEGLMGTFAEKWMTAGKEIGFQEGLEKGETVVRRTIKQILELRFDSVPRQVISELAERNLDELNNLVDIALEATSIDEFLAQLENQGTQPTT